MQINGILLKNIGIRIIENFFNISYLKYPKPQTKSIQPLNKKSSLWERI
jgi:hypothetical protein